MHHFSVPGFHGCWISKQVWNAAFVTLTIFANIACLGIPHLLRHVQHPHVRIRNCSVCLDVCMHGFRCGGFQVVMNLWILNFEISKREEFGSVGSLSLTLRVPCQGVHATRKIDSQVQWAHYGGGVFWKSKMMTPRKATDTMKWNVRTYSGRRSISVRFHSWGLTVDIRVTTDDCGYVVC